MSLSQLMREHVSTVFLNADHFAEQILLHLDGYVKLKAIVDIPDVVDTIEGDLDVTGSILLSTAELSRLRLADKTVLEATIRKTVWQLYDQSTDEFGMVRFAIRRKRNAKNQKYTNLYDIHGQQATWHEP